MTKRKQPPTRKPAAPGPAAEEKRPLAPLAIGAAALGVVFFWAYAPSWQKILHAWNVEPDYSHGYFVIPLAAFFLWMRRDKAPELQGPAWGGLGLLAFALALKTAGAVFYIDALDSWSIPIWLAGAFWLVGGWRFCRWAAPALAFLWFMIPLPYRAETALSLPLQGVATSMSCWTLQSLGQPALAHGNVIDINGFELEVAQACSGLRIFISVVALAYAFAVLVPRPWWMKGLLFASVLPVAVVANSVRVTLNGLLLPRLDSEAARHWAHDISGWITIPLAAALLGLVLLYLSRLFVQVRVAQARDLLHPA